MTAEKQALDYLIINQADFIIIDFRGALTRETLAVFERFRVDLERREGHYFVLSLAHVSDVDHKLLPHFIRLQKSIRDRNGYLKIWIPNEQLRQFLEYAGAVRRDELVPSVSDALIELRNLAKLDQSLPPEARDGAITTAYLGARGCGHAHGKDENDFERALAGIPDPDDVQEEGEEDEPETVQQLELDNGKRAA